MCTDHNNLNGAAWVFYQFCTVQVICVEEKSFFATRCVRNCTCTTMVKSGRKYQGEVVM